MAVDTTVYEAVKKDLLELIRTKKCNPLMIRLAWHDSGTYDKVASAKDTIWRRSLPQTPVCCYS